MKWAPRLLLAALLLGVPAAVLWSQATRSGDGAAQVVTLHARMPEEGGWSLDEIRAEVGQEIRFRLTSDDVVHGFAIARSGMDPISLEPGRWQEVTWLPTAPGEYTFYCTRWCGPNHWRMTGTIIVADPQGIYPTPTAAPPPRFVRYGVDIDQREVVEKLAGLRPSAERGADLGLAPQNAWLEARDPGLTTPIEAWRRLRADPALAALDDAALWDLLAHLWTERLDREQVRRGLEIFQANCAACHGPQGGGDGVMAEAFADPPVASFTDLARMATASSVVLEGKILRGGMGTGMPYWGSILQPAQVDALVQAIWWMALSGQGARAP